VLLVISVAAWRLIDALWDAWVVRLFFGRQREYLQSLSQDEKEVLALFIGNQKTAISLPINSGVVKLLEAQLVISRASSIGAGSGLSFAYIIQPWAWQYLNEHPELVLSAREGRDK
jgi:superinfection exclusion protein B